MQPKKNPKFDLERKRGLYLQLGFIIALLLVFIAFEYKSYDNSDSSLGKLKLDDIEEEIIPITEQKVKPPPPPPKPPEVIEVVKNNVEIEDSVIIESSEVNENDSVYYEYEEEDDEEIFMVVEESPEFPCIKITRKKEKCGVEGLTHFLQNNIEYPEVAKRYEITGKVFVQFVVEKNGKVTNVIVLRGVDPSLDKEAIRVVESFPDWKPGKQRGKSVRVYFTVPISFTLS